MGDEEWGWEGSNLADQRFASANDGRIRNYFTTEANSLVQFLRGEMQKIVSFRDLQVWQLGMNLVVAVYRVTETLATK